MSPAEKSHKVMSMLLDDYFAEALENSGCDKCVICDKHVDRKDLMILPDLDLKLGPWHAECFAFFTAYNCSKVWDNYEDMVKVQREEPDGFVKVVTILLKAVRAEEKERRRCQPLQLTS